MKIHSLLSRFDSLTIHGTLVSNPYPMRFRNWVQALVNLMVYLNIATPMPRTVFSTIQDLDYDAAWPIQKGSMGKDGIILNGCKLGKLKKFKIHSVYAF